MRFCISFVLCCSLLCLLFACVAEPKEAPLTIEEVLPGYWEVINATRNGNQVPSLENAYFEFDSLGTISTNYSGKQVVTDYKFVDQSIIYQESKKENKLDFKIKSRDTLQLNTIIRKIHNFELTLLRTEKEE